MFRSRCLPVGKEAAPLPQLLRSNLAAASVPPLSFSFGSKLVVIDFRTTLSARRDRADIIGRELRERRSMAQACADLRAKYENCPTPRLARMIEQLQAEIEIRQAR